MKESEKDKYRYLTRELKKTVEQESEVYNNWCYWYSHQSISKGTWGLGNKRKSEGHLNYIIEIGQNTEKSPGNLRRLAVRKNSSERSSANADGKKLSQEEEGEEEI